MTSSRSRAYPAITLEPAVKLSDQHIDKHGLNGCDRNSVIDDMGYTSSTGWAARQLAALGHFDLLQRQNGVFQPTSLAERLYYSEDQEEVRSARLEAIRRPALYREIIDRYSDSGTVPSDLPRLLVQEHGITEAAKNDVANNFVESAVFAGLISSEGEFLINEDQGNVTRFPEGNLSNESTTIQGRPLRDVRIAFTDKDFVQVTLPPNMDRAGYEVLVKMLECYLFQDESNVESDNGSGESASILKWG